MLNKNRSKIRPVVGYNRLFLSVSSAGYDYVPQGPSMISITCPSSRDNSFELSQSDLTQVFRGCIDRASTRMPIKH